MEDEDNMRVIVQREWTFTEALEAAWEAYQGGVELGTTNRLRVLSNWANMVGRTRAIHELNSWVESEGSQVSEKWRQVLLTSNSIRLLRKRFQQMPEYNGGLTLQSTPSIFISHNWSDKEFARRLAHDLQLAGVKVWIDELEIKLGDSLIQKIREGIDGVDYVAALISSNSVKSEWVTKELDVAMNQEIGNRKVKVIPLRLDSCEMPGFLLGKLYADCRTSDAYHLAFNQILDRIGILDVQQYANPQIRKLAGKWTGGWQYNGSERSVELEIDVGVREPMANMRISYQKNGERTVIDENMKLSVMSDHAIQLSGIGYNFLSKGTAKGWHLSTLTLAIESGVLHGEMVDTRKRRAIARFTRYS